jgi:hypothetical protein
VAKEASRQGRGQRVQMMIVRGGASMLALCACLACDAHTGARVVVRDSSGIAVKDASVRLVPEGDGIVGQGAFRKDESYTVGRTHGPWAGSSELIVEKGGYQTFRTRLNAGVRYNCEITFNEKESLGQCNPRSE